MTQPPKNERGPLLRASMFALQNRSVMAMTGVMATRPKLDRRQFKIGDPGRDIEPGLALHADRLQRIGILRTADQQVAAATDSHRRVSADAAVFSGEIVASKSVGWRVNRPGKPGLLGDAEIHPEAMN